MGRRSIGLEAVANQLYGRLAGACGDGGLVDWPGAGGWDLAGCWLRAGAFNVRRMLRPVCHLRSPWPPFSTNAWADLLAWRGGVLPAFSALQQPSAALSGLKGPTGLPPSDSPLISNQWISGQSAWKQWIDGNEGWKQWIDGQVDRKQWLKHTL